MSVHPATHQLLRLLFWESTIRCNLSCAHCRRLESNEAADADLSTSQAKNLMDQLVEVNPVNTMTPILVFSGGEPLCRPDIFELFEYARSLSITPALATNGTLIDETIARRIKESGIARVAISIDGATAEFHDRLRRLHGSFDQAITGIRYLAAQGVSFQINMTITRHNCGQVEHLYELAHSLGAAAVHLFMLVPVGCGQTLAQTDMLSPEEYEKIMLKIHELERRAALEIKVTCGPHYERVRRQHRQDNQPDALLPKSPAATHGNRGSSRGCLAGLGVLFVGHQGDVFPCGYLPVKCGNILKESLSQIWYGSSDLAVMRDSDRLEGKCGVCGFRQVCGGCRGRAYSVAGNYMAEEPFCAYIPPEATR
jgi:radical SAM protein with 4Fe4S-binding SPASM domain